MGPTRSAPRKTEPTFVSPFALVSRCTRTEGLLEIRHGSHLAVGRGDALHFQAELLYFAGKLARARARIGYRPRGRNGKQVAHENELLLGQIGGDNLSTVGIGPEIVELDRVGSIA